MGEVEILKSQCEIPKTRLFFLYCHLTRTCVDFCQGEMGAAAAGVVW